MDEYREHSHKIITLRHFRAYFKAFRNLLSPIIDSGRKMMRNVAKLIASLIQGFFWYMHFF